MSNDGFGKVRQKRSHGQTKPYERRKSLLGRVTDTVKDLIAPSWLSGLVGKSSTEPASREPPGTVSEQSEDEQFMSPPQSPPTRPYGVPARDKVTMNNHGKPIPRGTLPAFPVPTFESTPLVQNSRVARKPDSVQTPVGLSRLPLPAEPGPSHANPQTDDNMSDHSDGSKSTSGCSSMIPHPDKREYQREILQLNESSLQKLKDQLQIPGAEQTSTPLPNTARSSQTTTIQRQTEDPGVSGILDNSVNISLSRTWTSSYQTSRLRDPTVRSKPSFNMSLFGTPGLGNTSLFGESLHESTFYPGKVGYGGAAQFRKGKNKPTAPYEIAAPYRTKIKARPANKATSGALTSSTAKRILETLERMSTPLSDAKKIPVDIASSDSLLSFTPGNYLKRPRMSGNNTGLNRRSLGVPMRGPPLNQLSTPCIASIAKNRQKLSFSTTPKPAQGLAGTSSAEETITQEPRKVSEAVVPPVPQSDMLHSSVRRCDTVPVSEIGRVGGKMKRDKSHHYSSKKGEEEEDVVEVPDLKTEFTLPVVNMPKFNFTGTSVTSAPKPTLSPQRNLVGEDKSSTSLSSSIEFTFSNPIASLKPDHSPGSNTPKMDFQFSSPINIDSKDKGSPSNMFAFSSSQQTLQPRPRKVYENVNEIKPASEIKSGSVTDILGSKTRPDNKYAFENSNTPNFKFGSSFTANKPKPKESLTNSAESFSGGIAPPAQLKMGSVMDILGGKNATSKDSVSEGVKPASNLKPGSVMDILGKESTKTKADETWAKLCAPTDNLECDTCLIPNKPSETKPGQSTSQALATTAPSTPSGGSLWDQFKPPPDSWECPTCMIQNKSTSIACVACATAKPASQGTSSAAAPQTTTSGFGTKFLPPAGSWECDTCLIQNKAQDTFSAACESPKPGANTAAKSDGTAQKKSTGPWECDTCMINNKEDAVKCIACETPRPGSKTTSGGLTFAPNAFSSSGGFKFESTSGGSTGGFKFGSADKTGESSKGGILFGAPTTSTTTASSSSSSGFVFGNKDSKPTETTTGFVFGNKDSKPTETTTGFVFGNTDSKPTETTTGFVFGNTDSKPTEKTTGFVFGSNKASENTNSSNGSGFVFGSVGKKDKDKEKPLSESAGFQFGKVEEKPKEQSAAAGTGFVFGSATKTDSEVTKSEPASFSFGNTSTSTKNVVSESSGTVSQTQETSSETGFRKSMTSATSSVPESSSAKINSNFTFGQTNPYSDVTAIKTLNNNTEVKSSQQESKPFGGGFTFTSGTSQTTTATKPGFGGFSAKKDDTTPQSSSASGFTGFGSVKSENNILSSGNSGAATKRSSSDADTEPSAKKAFGFSSNTGASVAPVFNFTAGSNASGTGSGSNDLFKFGQQPATSTAPSTAPLGTGGFSSITSGTVAPGFGSSTAGFGSSTTFGSTTTTVSTSVFGNTPAPSFGQGSGSFGSNTTTATFGGTTQTGNNSAFGTNSLPNPANQSAPSLFSNKASTFGGTSTTRNVFGSSGGFGTTGSAFGADSSSSFSGFNSAPAFGGSNTFGSGTSTTFGSSTPTTTANSTSGGFNFSSAANFNFGSSNPNSSSAVFQFGAKADTGPSAATAPQPPQPQTTFGHPQPAQPPAPTFNFSATPNSNFSAPGAFTFNAVQSGDTNPFNVQNTAGRRIKKAVRKTRK